MPPWNLKVCLIEGLKKSKEKEGRSAMWPQAQATVFVEGDSVFHRGEEPLTEMDFLHTTQGRIPPKTGPMVTIWRPAVDTPWLLPFVLNVVDDRRNEAQLRRGMEEAGLLCGIGSWRPENGRFIVTRWEIEK